LILLIINGYIQKFIKRPKKNKTSHINTENMKTLTIIVKGMTCNHCKANVENTVGSVPDIESVQVDLTTSKVTITGENINLDDVKAKVESIGYEYGGLVE